MVRMGSTRRTEWSVRPATPDDRDVWDALYTAYGATAGDDLSQEHLDTVWSWLMSPSAQTDCRLLQPAHGSTPVGLAHFRPFERPLHGSVGCYLDDLYVEEEWRGRGGARALLDHLSRLAHVKGWTTVRWTTREDNPAQELYDTLASRAPVITFTMEPTADRRT